MTKLDDSHNAPSYKSGTGKAGKELEMGKMSRTSREHRPPGKGRHRNQS